LASERFEGRLLDFLALVDVDRAACVSIETRIEPARRILKNDVSRKLDSGSCPLSGLVRNDRDDS
jgi:hypothetical protein